MLEQSAPFVSPDSSSSNRVEGGVKTGLAGLAWFEKSLAARGKAQCVEVEVLTRGGH
jgi:hypothetical protein